MNGGDEPMEVAEAEAPRGNEDVGDRKWNPEISSFTDGNLPSLRVAR